MQCVSFMLIMQSIIFRPYLDDRNFKDLKILIFNIQIDRYISLPKHLIFQNCHHGTLYCSVVFYSKLDAICLASHGHGRYYGTAIFGDSTLYTTH